MLKTYKTELIPDNEVTSLIDLELNELKLNAVITEIEQEILSLRIKKTLLLKNKAESEKKKAELSAPAQKSWFQARRESVSRYIGRLFGAIKGE